MIGKWCEARDISMHEATLKILCCWRRADIVHGDLFSTGKSKLLFATNNPRDSHISSNKLIGFGIEIRILVAKNVWANQMRFARMHFVKSGIEITQRQHGTMTRKWIHPLCSCLKKTFPFHQMVCHYVARIGCKLPFSHQELEVSRRLGDKIQYKNWQDSAGNEEQQWNQLLRNNHLRLQTI